MGAICRWFRRRRASTLDRSGEVWFRSDARSVSEILLDSGRVNLCEGTRGLYVIGSPRGGTDTAANQVFSYDSDGRTLHSPSGTEVGAPFAFRARRIDGRTLEIRVEVGPLPCPYEALSVPLDCRPDLIDTFTHDGWTYQVGAGNRWESRSGSGAPFDSIPQWATIPGVGRVGMARTDRPPTWLEIRGPTVAARRIVLEQAGLRDGFLVRHPWCRTAELSFVGDPAITPPAPTGSVFRLVERLVVTPRA